MVDEDGRPEHEGGEHDCVGDVQTLCLTHLELEYSVSADESEEVGMLAQGK